MSELTKHEHVANIIAFFCIMFGENSAVWDEVMKLAPDYLIDKFVRYVLSTRVEYQWGMHPCFRDMCFNHYVDKWQLELKDE